MNPALLAPTGYKRGTRTTPTTDTGWATYNAGSRLFLPASTNYCMNPSCETWTNGPSAVPDDFVGIYNTASAPTFSRVGALAGSMGQYALRVQHTSVGDSGKNVRVDYGPTAVGSFAPGDVVTISFLLTAPVKSAGCVLRAEANWRTDVDGGITEDTIAYIVQSANVTRYSATITAPALASRLRLMFFTASTTDDGDAIDFTVDDICIEKSSVLTPYFDGAYANCAWTGTANASTSTRSSSNHIISSGMPIGLHLAGTIAARFVPLWSPVGNTTYHVIAVPSRGVDYSGYAALYGNNTDTVGVEVGVTAGVTNSVSAAQSFASGTTHSIIGRYTNDVGGNLDLNIDGTDVAQIANIRASAEFDRIFLGANTTNANSFLGYIGPIIISPTRKSDAWTAAIQANGGAAFGNLNNLWRTYMSPGDMLIPLKSDGYGWVKR